MECVENIPVERLTLLKKLTLADYVSLLGKTKYKKNEIKAHYNKIMHYVNSAIPSRGGQKHLYHFGVKTPQGGQGRLTCSSSIQAIDGIIRGFLFQGITTDLDMRSAHPTILLWLCKKHKISSPYLTEYVYNRDTILLRNGIDKTKICELLNDSNSRRLSTDWLKKFHKECRVIQKEVCDQEEYEEYLEISKHLSQDNTYGSCINRIMCLYENSILQSIIKIVTENHINITALMYDGLLLEGNHYENDDLLSKCEAQIEKDFEGLNMKLAYKEHSNKITREYLESLEEVEYFDKEKTFEVLRKKFESNHCKIVNKALFIKEVDDTVVVMTRKGIKEAYEHIQYCEQKDDKVVSGSFIIKWLSTNYIRLYEDMKVYPTGLVCPNNIYNMWKPFAMEKIEKYEKKDISLILKHIEILCGNDKDVYDYMIKWISQLIQYPAVKSTCPTMISREGAGKGRLIELMRLMLGNSKVYETSTPSRDVWGDFNGIMSNTYLVNLNELSKKETVESEGKIKALITDPTITINKKGIDPYEIKSYHRFIITTNNEEPINTKKDDRRNFIIRSSDEKIGNKEYFTTLVEMMKDTDVIKTCYEYFKNIPDMDKFNKLPLPVTEYHNELKQLSMSPIELFIKDYVEQKSADDDFRVKTGDLYEEFKKYIDTNNIKYTINGNQFAVRLNREFGQRGIDTVKTNTCNMKQFDVKKIKKELGVGSLVEM